MVVRDTDTGGRGKPPTTEGYDLLRIREPSELLPLVVRIVDRHFEVRGDRCKSPVEVCVLGSVDTVGTHVQAWAIIAPGFVVSDRQELAWLFFVIPDISAAIADASVLTFGSNTRIANFRQCCMAKVGRDTALAPSVTACVEWTRIEFL